MGYIDFRPADRALLVKIIKENNSDQVESFVRPGGTADQIADYLERRGPSGPSAQN